MYFCLCIRHQESVKLWHYSLQDKLVFLCMLDIQIFINISHKFFGRILMKFGLFTTYVLEQMSLVFRIKYLYNTLIYMYIDYIL